MKFSEINFANIENNGFDKLLVLRNGQLLVGGLIKNVMIHEEILKNKEIDKQYGDEDIWVLEISE